MVKNTTLFSFIFMLTLMVQQANAQCTAIINTFPYNEGFENADDGKWTSFPANSWACGLPATTKQVIQSAGSGVKCWIVGGLSASSYASGNSELRSPCFNFTTLTNPEISFKVFWETERRFDGATFQYSLDNGNNFTTLGTVNSPANCQGTNWYTYTPINFLGGEPGWSGNIQTGGGGGNNCLYGLGSGTWVTAKHNMAMLAGQSNVIFRFYFGAGTQCNDFDGFAVDDIYIAEAPPPNVANFSYTCGLNGAVQFTNLSSACSVQWDFGEPASGANNSSTLDNPAHTYLTLGQSYVVTMTANFPAGPVIKTATIYTVNATPQINASSACFGDNNWALSAATPTGGPSSIYTYSWNTNPVQTSQSVSNLPDIAGQYLVTVSSPGACSSTFAFSFNDPLPLNVAVVTSAAKCGNNNGSISSTLTGGTVPYQYLWNTSPVQLTSSIINLAPGMYDLTVTDDNGCSKQVPGIEIKAEVNIVNASLGPDITICPGQSLVLNPGSFASYKWQDNSTNPTYTVTQTGDYSVQVVDADGCTGSGSVKITVDCKDIYFPSAFTPNGDASNPGFGAIGDIASLQQYSLDVYNRYGQKVFSSTDPNKKWDGRYKGVPSDMQTFIWIATYTQRSRVKQARKGTITLIR